MSMLSSMNLSKTGELTQLETLLMKKIDGLKIYLRDKESQLMDGNNICQELEV